MKSSGLGAITRDLDTIFGTGVIGGYSDAYLLGRFVERHEAVAFEALVHRHGPMVWGVCSRVLRDSHDAEDAFQATFLVLARRAASVVPREKLGNWLYGVAHQTAMKARANRSKRRGREVQVPDMPEPIVMPDRRQDELSEYLEQELSRLPEKYRTPLILCDLEGMAHREAANQLGWPVGTVTSRLVRARARLAKRLTRRGVTLAGGTLVIGLSQCSASAVMPIRLVGCTAQAASLIAAGAEATGLVSVGVMFLMREVLKTMLLSKLKVVMLAALAISGIGVGGVLYGSSNAAGPIPQPEKSEVRTQPDSLDTQIRSFNVAAADDPIGKAEPALTRDEVVAAIRWAIRDKSNIPVSPPVFVALGEVARTGVLPEGFELEKVTGYEPNDEVTFEVWSVRLRVPGEQSGTFAITIREKMIRSRLIGEEERKVIRAWNAKEQPGGFERAEWLRRYRQERAEAAAVDGSEGPARQGGK